MFISDIRVLQVQLGYSGKAGIFKITIRHRKVNTIF